MGKYNIQHIEKLRIHELRDFARTVGVSSPTTMKKNELITRIKSLLIDGDKESINNFKHPKDEDAIDFLSLLTSTDSNLFNALIAGQEKKIKKDVEQDDLNTIIVKKKPVLATDSKSYYPTEEFLSFNLRQDFAEFDASEEIGGGYLDIHPEGYGIIRKNGFIPSAEDIYVTKATVKDRKLKKGHYVHGKIRSILENKPKVMYEVSSIDNAKDVKKTLSYDDYSYNALGKVLYLDKFGLKINRGARIYIKSASYESLVKLGYDLVEENAPSVKLINIKSRPEERFESYQKLTIVDCPFNLTEVEVVNAVELVADRVKREFEYGKSNIIIINNFSELIKIFNAAIEGYYDSNRFNARAMNKITNLLYLAKNANDKLSTTIICVDNNSNNEISPIVKSECMGLFNAVYDELK